ncbi:MAG: ParB N-terminal domain-containing protein [Eubacteriales bacterium]
MPLEDLQHFPNHKFKLYEGEQLSDMVSSVEEFGILLPLIVWQKEDEPYTILSGHNRFEAAQLAGLQEVPVIIKEDLTEEEDTLIVTETNLRQRSFGDLSHSERAFSLAQHYEAMKKQGKRTDILNELSDLLNPVIPRVEGTSPQIGAKLRTDEKVGGSYGLSKNSTARYIRLATLNLMLLEQLDEGKLPMSAAYDLSFIENPEIQEALADEMERGQKVDMKKAELLRQTFEKGKLTKEVMNDVLEGKKVAKQPKTKAVSIPKRIFNTYFQPEQSKAEIEEILEEALEMYYKNREECI